MLQSLLRALTRNEAICLKSPIIASEKKKKIEVDGPSGVVGVSILTYSTSRVSNNVREKNMMFVSLHILMLTAALERWPCVNVH